MTTATFPAGTLTPMGDARAITRLGNLLALGLVIGAGGWMSLAPLSGAVIAPAYVKVDMNRSTVQHQEGGQVQEILVRDGSRVKAGQALIILKDVRVDSTQDMLRNQLDSTLAKVARLDAERAGMSVIGFPAELTRRAGEAGVADLLVKEKAVFDSRQQSLQEQLQLIAGQARDIEAEIAARDRQSGSDQRALELQEQDVKANEALVKEGFVSKSRLLLLQRSSSDYESRRHQNLAELAQSRQRLTELRLRAAGLRHDRMREAALEHKEALTQLVDLREKLRPWQDQQQRQTIMAPVSGEVVNLRITSAGGVVGPREALLDIVPDKADLVVESRIRPEDINSVRSGAPADVRLTSFRQRVTPVVTGEVVYVSADRLEDKTTGQAYYQAHVKVSPESLRAAGVPRLQAGMPAEVFVKTGERTALAYFMEPVSGFLGRSLREP